MKLVVIRELSHITHDPIYVLKKAGEVIGHLRPISYGVSFYKFIAKNKDIYLDEDDIRKIILSYSNANRYEVILD